MKIQLLFNAQNREFIGFGASNQEYIRNSNVLTRDVELDTTEFNLARYTYIGNYDDGQLIDRNLNPTVVTEQDVVAKHIDILHRSHPQISKNLSALLYAHYTDNYIKDFVEMLQDIKDDIDHYKNSKHHRYESFEDIFNTTKNAFSA